MTLSKKALRRMAPLVVATALIAGCSSTSKSTGSNTAAAGGSGSSSAKLTKITLDMIPIEDAAPVYMGKKMGFFAAQGLDVTINQAPNGGPQILPALVSGQAQFGDPAVMDLVLAVAQGLPVKGVGVESHSGATPATDMFQLTTLKSSGITDISQLKGKKIAINALNGLGQVLVDAALRNAGMTASDVSFVPINFPDMNNALSGGQVAAIWQTEPFLTQLTQSGVQTNLVSPTSLAIAPNLPISVWVTSKSFLSAHPDTVRAFQKAIAQSISYANAHPDEVRAAVPTFTSVTTAVADKMALYTLDPTISQTAIQQYVDATFAAGIITKKPDVSTLFTANPLP